MSTPEDRVAERLRRLVAEVDPPPALVRDAALAAFALRTLDADLADLTADSWTGAAPVGTRAADAGPRMLSFESGSLTIELDIETDLAAGTSSLRGVVVGGVGGLTLVRRDSRATVAVAEDGTFEIDGVPRGPLRLETTTADGRHVATSWVTA